MVRIYGESLIFLWDDLLALKMSKIIIWNNTDKHMECGQCLSTAISVFPQCGLVEPHLSPGLWCLAKLTQRGWSHPMMWRSNPSKTSDVSVYVFFFWEEVLYYLHQTYVSRRKQLAGSEWEGGLDDLQRSLPTNIFMYLWGCLLSIT